MDVKLTSLNSFKCYWQFYNEIYIINKCLVEWVQIEIIRARKAESQLSSSSNSIKKCQRNSLNFLIKQTEESWGAQTPNFTVPIKHSPKSSPTLAAYRAHCRPLMQVHLGVSLCESKLDAAQFFFNSHNPWQRHIRVPHVQDNSYSSSQLAWHKDPRLPCLTRHTSSRSPHPSMLAEPPVSSVPRDSLLFQRISWFSKTQFRGNKTIITVSNRGQTKPPGGVDHAPSYFTNKLTVPTQRRRKVNDTIVPPGFNKKTKHTQLHLKVLLRQRAKETKEDWEC